MFSLREFVKRGLLEAIGKMADYQIILNAVGWYEKGVLLEEDLADIQAKIDDKNNTAAEEEIATSTADEEQQQPEETNITEVN